MSRLFKLTLMLCIAILFTPYVDSYAELNNISIAMTCDNTTPTCGEEFSVCFIVDSPAPVNISAYRLRINFDSTKLMYKGLYSDIDNDDFKTYVNGNTINLLYVTTEQGFDVAAGCSMNILELNFKVLSAAASGRASISAVIDGLANYDVEEIPCPDIPPLDITITKVTPGDCSLSLLGTKAYTLTPAFSSNVTHYSVDVPASKNAIEFDAIPVDKDASVKVSRKTLKSAGSSTDINITVTSADKKARQVYTVTVNRLAKVTSSGRNDGSSGTDISTGINSGNNFDYNLSTGGGFGSRDLNDSLKTSAEPLVVTKNGFNPIIFVVISAIFLFLSVLSIVKLNKR